MVKLKMLAWTCLLHLAGAQNSTYINPMISDWASDPSCIRVDETFFCALSTFIAFPGLPIYASNDLVSWKLISHAWNHDSQLPGFGLQTTNQQGGMYAPNLRHHEGVFHTTDPFENAAWSDPVIYNSSSIDPDLFWDDDGKVYLTSAGIIQQEIDLETGNVTEPVNIWNGTGGASPEGPHIYKKDGFYYLMIAEGGTELGHSVTIARSMNVSGPWESYEKNPVLSNANTTEYFQTVGHADLFQDKNGKWWAAALSTRSGPEWKIYPMGRESALTAVTWDEGEWPVFSNVSGIENVWPLPPSNLSIPGPGAFNDDPDIIDFAPNTSIPSHFYFWRHPAPGTFTVSPAGHPNTLTITPQPVNLTGIATSNSTALNGQAGIPFIGRRQTSTLFTFSVDLLPPALPSIETGLSVFLTQQDHLDLAISHNNESLTATLRLYATPVDTTSNLNKYTEYQTLATTHALPPPWRDEKLRLGIWTPNATHYGFTAALAEDSNSRVILGYAEAERVSGRSGRFTGVLLGAYATCNGAGNGSRCGEQGDAYSSRWRYEDVAQYVADGVVGPPKK
ncbi:Non-reducing end alpha-L-arabinofuranosidase BoGH43B [Fulvia fulva]|nr:Non-reducing end alpha-L-arabinofuranosidase BoGH43B [Fulvia fulva]WPV30588.1 Non-reducing end alpha-L-arabinofuranosidase BoGH43B [Fulvia fulva]